MLRLVNLFHISLNKNLEGIWIPGEQAGFDQVGEQEDSSWPYPEPSMHAICTSPEINRCFLGVYPNISRFFTKDLVKSLDFAVYSPEFKGEERIVKPDTLTKDKLVWDAHVTKEHRILDQVKMNLVGIIRVKNTNGVAVIKTHPFNNSKNPLETVGPLDINYKWL